MSPRRVVALRRRRDYLAVRPVVALLVGSSLEGCEFCAEVETRSAPNDLSATLAAAWRGLRDDVLAAWVAVAPLTRPPAWWTHDAPEPRDLSETEGAYLARHGLVLPGEVGPADPAPDTALRAAAHVLDALCHDVPPVHADRMEARPCPPAS